MSVAKHTYELTYIVNAVISDDQIKDVVSRVSSYISESGGEIIRVDEWGSQRLAFPIQKKRNGYYVNMYFHAAGSLISRLERALEIDDNILRYLTLRMDAKMIRHFESGKSAMPYREDAAKDKAKPRSSERGAARSEAVKSEPAAAKPVAAPVATAATDTPAADADEAAAVAEPVAEDTAAEEVTEVVTAEVVAEEAVAEPVAEDGAPESSPDEADAPVEVAEADASGEETERAEA